MMNAKRIGPATIVLLTFLLLGAGSAPAGEALDAVWSELLGRTPYPYLVPLPPARPTVLDGVYTKVETKDTPPVHCRRCPDYAPEGGVWKLQLDKGVFRLYHPSTGWKAIGTFIVTRDDFLRPDTGQLLLANDPVCQESMGLYRWTLGDGRLTLTVLEDNCAIRLRAQNLTHLPWSSCRPPNREAAITDHWPKPEGCD